MAIKTSLLQDYVKVVDSTTKQNIYFKRNIFLFATILSLFLIFLAFKYHTKYYLYNYIKNYIIIRIRIGVIRLY